MNRFKAMLSKDATLSSLNPMSQTAYDAEIRAAIDNKDEDKLLGIVATSREKINNIIINEVSSFDAIMSSLKKLPSYMQRKKTGHRECKQ